MNTLIARFIGLKTVVSIVLYLILKEGARMVPSFFLYAYQFELIFLFFVIGTIGYFIVKLITRRNPERFALTFLAYVTVKLLLLMSIAAFIMIQYSSTALTFAVNFLIIYVMFSVFEAFSMVKYLKNIG